MQAISQQLRAEFADPSRADPIVVFPLLTGRPARRFDTARGSSWNADAERLIVALAEGHYAVAVTRDSGPLRAGLETDRAYPIADVSRVTMIGTPAITLRGPAGGCIALSWGEFRQSAADYVIG